MSNGSKPVITMGTLKRAEMGSYSRNPITVQTCPGPRKACTRFKGDWRMDAIEGGTRTWDTRIEKFLIPCCRACHAAIALAGAVVSNPIAKKTTFFDGFARAIFRQSIGE